MPEPTGTGAEERRWTMCSECGWNLGVCHLDPPFVAKVPEDRMCPWCGEDLKDCVDASAVAEVKRERDRWIDAAQNAAQQLRAERDSLAENQLTPEEARLVRIACVKAAPEVGGPDGDFANEREWDIYYGAFDKLTRLSQSVEGQ
jgi:hypothetical protein